VKTLVHHITESNWLPYIIIAMLLFYVYLLTEQKNKLALQSEVDREATSIIAQEFHNRIANLEKSKQVENETFEGIRTIRYK
jgi:hypothetical protein